MLYLPNKETQRPDEVEPVLYPKENERKSANDVSLILGPKISFAPLQ